MVCIIEGGGGYSPGPEYEGPLEGAEGGGGGPLEGGGRGPGYP